jgi:hypothetical protein
MYFDSFKKMVNFKTIDELVYKIYPCRFIVEKARFDK